MDRPSHLMERARGATGLSDFGPDSFREGLSILVASADGEARLTEQGAAAFDAMIVDHLARRLEVQDWYTRHPEIDEQEIVSPLIVLGLPRTGSTALHSLLAEDPAVRVIRGWEATAPCPPPETATEHSDPRIARQEAFMVYRAERFPRMVQMVPSTATGPTECQTFMAQDFASHIFQAMAQVPSYTDWVNNRADLVPTYAHVKRVLKLLQWRCPPNRWRLKNPSNIVWIDALDTVFPDARYCMTHRDVAKVLPSGADLYYELIRAFSDDVDKHFLGQVHIDTWTLGIKRMIAFRERTGNEKRFFDIHFAPFQRDPFPTLHELYGWLGETLSPEAEARMRAWREAMPREQHGAHLYDPADFGLDSEDLHRRFAFYSDKFGVLEAN